MLGESWLGLWRWAKGAPMEVSGATRLFRSLVTR